MNDITQAILNVISDKLDAFIFERIEPYQDNEVIKDWNSYNISIYCWDTYIQHMINEDILIHCESILKFLYC